jgi:hypothetical protein
VYRVFDLVGNYSNKCHCLPIGLNPGTTKNTLNLDFEEYSCYRDHMYLLCLLVSSFTLTDVTYIVHSIPSIFETRCVDDGKETVTKFSMAELWYLCFHKLLK